ncbi:MAG: hypothetical protein KDK23_17630, partial [Leptospiraceae bacterium]|nr:hypothetical protein [Leptospiraceae bacterium]
MDRGPGPGLWRSPGARTRGRLHSLKLRSVTPTRISQKARKSGPFFVDFPGGFPWYFATVNRKNPSFRIYDFLFLMVLLLLVSCHPGR